MKEPVVKSTVTGLDKLAQLHVEGRPIPIIRRKTVGLMIRDYMKRVNRANA